jgi:outer membrane protein assembly factor BamB
MRMRLCEVRGLTGALLLAVAAAGGCTPTSTAVIPDSPPWYNRAAAVLEVVFRRDVVADSRHSGEPYEQGEVALDPVHNRVYVGSSDGGFYALSARDGRAVWRFETLGPVQSEPLYDGINNVVYFGSHDGALYKVRARDGAMLWRFASNAEVARRPVLVGETLYAVNANDTVIAVNAETGQLQWSQHRTPAMGMEISGHSGLTVMNGRVHVAFSDGTVTAYAADTGKERWLPVDLSAEAEQSLGEVPQYLDVDTTPVPVNLNGRLAVAVGSYEGGVFLLDAETGDQIWSNSGVLGVTNVSLWQQPAHEDAEGHLHPARAHLIVSTGTTGLWALDPATGDELWQRDLPNGGVSKPAFIAGAMLVTTTTQGVYLLSPLNGGVIDGFHTELGLAAAPVAHGERAYVVGNGGQLLALSVHAPRPLAPARSSSQWMFPRGW